MSKAKVKEKVRVPSLGWTRGYADMYLVTNADGYAVRGFMQRDVARGWIAMNTCTMCKAGKTEPCPCARDYKIATLRLNGGDQKLPGVLKVWVIVDKDSKPVQAFVDRDEAKSVKRNFADKGYSRGSIIVENYEETL